MTSIDRVRVVVIGDSGVGKTSLVHLITHNKVMKSPSWTVGASVEVKLHEYKEGTNNQETYFIEFWDIGGSSSHRNARSVFYTPTHGIILVHDLSNIKSQHNLQKWLHEVLFQDPTPTTSPRHSFSYGQEDTIDTESFLGSTQIPILVIGTKLSTMKGKTNQNRHKSKISEQIACDELFVDCLESRAFAPGSSNAVCLSRFYDKVIERKFHLKDTSNTFSRRKWSPTTSLPIVNAGNGINVNYKNR